MGISGSDHANGLRGRSAHDAAGDDDDARVQNTSPPVIVVQAEVGIVGWVRVLTGERLTVSSGYCEKPHMAKYGESGFVEAPRAPMVEAEPYDPTEVHQQGPHDEEKGGVPRRRNQIEWKAVPG
ncbi:unnamed protein product [Heligmosomoides polygyrus]|uniref:Uncharacterized protein n=1 Tax=Heligmosomoides polygyrus TaxID=6339 RepID=A0A183FF00_HELPZ|nr:unnamed protein product [Heligmosomoides polygyrus]